MKEQKIHFLMRCLQVVFVFSLFIVLLQLYISYYLPTVVDKYTKKYTEITVKQAISQIEQNLPEIINPYVEQNNARLSDSIAEKYTQETAQKVAREIEQKLPAVIGSYLEQNNIRLTDSITQILQQNATAISRQPSTIQDKIDTYMAQLLKLKLPGQSPVVLSDTADVVIFEFMDYQCGFCKRFYTSVETTKEMYEKLQVKYIDYPILGDMSYLSATIALALSEQGLYEAMHHALMRHQGQLTPQGLEEIGDTIGVDKQRLAQSIKNAEFINAIRNNLRMGKVFGLEGTPYSLIVSFNKQGKLVGEDINGYVNAQTLSRLVQKYSND